MAEFLFGSLQKIDAERREVFGYATTATRDRTGETIDLAAVKRALPRYLEHPAVREMHQPSAVGRGIEASLDKKGLWFGAHIVDDRAWKKVQNKVYNGFSVGGKVTKRDPDDPMRITGIDLMEISLVDRPCNPDADFALIKKHEKAKEPPDPKFIRRCAQACLPFLLKIYLPMGSWQPAGGQYTSQHPHAPALRKRFYPNDVICRDNGSWLDRFTSTSGNNVVELIAHLEDKSIALVEMELSKSLKPSDALVGRLEAQSDYDNSVPGMAMERMKAAGVPPALRAEQLLKIAAEGRPRMKFQRRK
jgi:phage head maturation protease